MGPVQYQATEARPGKGDACCPEGYPGDQKITSFVADVLEGVDSLFGGLGVGFGGCAFSEHFLADLADVFENPWPLRVGVFLFEGFPFLDVGFEMCLDFAYEVVCAEGGVEGVSKRGFVPSGELTGGACLIAQVYASARAEGAVVTPLGHGD